MTDNETIMRYDANKKSMLIAYLLWFFIGGLGVHRLYLGAMKSGLVMLVLFLISSGLSVILIGYLGFIVIGIWWLIDAFLIPGMVSGHNNALIDRLSR